MSQVHEFSNGGCVAHGLTGTWAGKCSAWYDAEGKLLDAEQIRPGPRGYPAARSVKRDGPIWRELKRLGPILRPLKGPSRALPMDPNAAAPSRGEIDREGLENNERTI